MVFRSPYRPRPIIRHASNWERMMQRFFSFVSSTRPIRVTGWIRDIRQLIYAARRGALSGQNLYYEWFGRSYEYSNEMHEAFQKLLTKLQRYKRRGIIFVASDVVNEYFQHLEL